VKPDPKKLIVYIPDTRGVTVSRYGAGNMKIGPNVFTYSRLPGSPTNVALGYDSELDEEGRKNLRGTCPGASDECQSICYACRPVAEGGAVMRMWEINSIYPDVPPIPDECKLLRAHISGDFDAVRYIESWIQRLTERPDVTFWAYTRSWRVPELLPALERLRALPNVQLFASMDKSITVLPPKGWRRAWIEGDDRVQPVARNPRLQWIDTVESQWQADITGVPELSFTCPEETGHKPNCEACRYCFDGKRNDVTFLKH
jgi:hypothetical protein